MAHANSIVTTPASLAPLLFQIQHQWPIIARDLVLMTSAQAGTTYDTMDVARTYGLTLSELQSLLAIPTFQGYVKEEKRKLEAAGPHAGNKARAEAMALDIQEVMYLRAKEGSLEDNTILKFLTHLARVSGLEPISSKDTGNVNQNAVSVTVNVPRLNNPKLAHLYPVEEVEYDE